MSNDGGHAFPIADAYDADGRLIAYGNAGMTLRDWFAGQALAGLVRDHAYLKNLEQMAYAIADNMLAEQERRK
jgi:photosystem II stability/assembly factor-like uncharacterized protein